MPWHAFAAALRRTTAQRVLLCVSLQRPALHAAWQAFHCCCLHGSAQVENFYVREGYLFPKYHIFYWMALTTPTADPQVGAGRAQHSTAATAWLHRIAYNRQGQRQAGPGPLLQLLRKARQRLHEAAGSYRHAS